MFDFGLFVVVGGLGRESCCYFLGGWDAEVGNVDEFVLIHVHFGWVWMMVVRGSEEQ